MYARISQDRTGEAAGVQRQEDDARKLAEARGWTVANVYIDNDISAAGKKTRPGFENVLRDLEAGRATVVIAWALDRLTRNRRDTVRLVETAQAAGATIALVRGSDMDMSTPAGRMIADLLAAVARAEIETKSDRQRRAYAQRTEQGLPSGGRRPFGYDVGGMTIREDEAEAVRDAYRWLLAGVPLREIARRWNDRGLPSPQLTRAGEVSWWSGVGVSQALRKPRYAGLTGTREKGPGGPAQWPALVDLDTWHAAQALMNNPERRPAKGDKKLLTGVATCGKCGADVWAGGGPTGRGVYRCSTSGCVVRRRSLVDEYLRAIMIERLSRDDALELLAPSSTDDGPGVGELAREIEQLRQRLEPLAGAYAEGALSLAQLRAATARINARMSELEQQLAATAGRTTAALHDVVTAEDVETAWDALSTDAQRQIIDALMTITLHPVGRGRTGLHPETIEIAWRQGA